MAGAAQLNQPAEEFGNDSRVEALWAIKAMEHADVYFNVSHAKIAPVTVSHFVDILLIFSDPLFS